ncbi:hypothetical protein POUND7_003588 [Theobroma cacao]
MSSPMCHGFFLHTSLPPMSTMVFKADMVRLMWTLFGDFLSLKSHGQCWKHPYPASKAMMELSLSSLAVDQGATFMVYSLKDPLSLAVDFGFIVIVVGLSHGLKELLQFISFGMRWVSFQMGAPPIA